MPGGRLIHEHIFGKSNLLHHVKKMHKKQFQQPQESLLRPMVFPDLYSTKKVLPKFYSANDVFPSLYNAKDVLPKLYSSKDGTGEKELFVQI